eukprot:TRINITY_DN14426_c0_g1_i1.p1 TRINITY_DN14426_c0_g1~~TRINITY_DN14426_c0_g1_i1.p1  ORF type:complete len:766 (-),score=84.84 TRINITY_DN14426_c0_g1_i1:127-2424(-)
METRRSQIEEKLRKQTFGISLSSLNFTVEKLASSLQQWFHHHDIGFWTTPLFVDIRDQTAILTVVDDDGFNKALDLFSSAHIQVHRGKIVEVDRQSRAKIDRGHRPVTAAVSLVLELCETSSKQPDHKYDELLQLLRQRLLDKKQLFESGKLRPQVVKGKRSNYLLSTDPQVRLGIGTAPVYLAREVDSRRWVAIKELDKSRDEQCIAEAEQKVGDRLHANLSARSLINGCLDHFHSDRYVYLVYDLAICSLQDLTSVPSYQKLWALCKWTTKLAVAQAMCHALHAVHRVGHIHRDVHVGNFLISEDGTVQIADFGLSRAIPEGATEYVELSRCHKAVSPVEVYEKHIAVRPAVDIFMLGSTLSLLLFGKYPFADGSHGTQEADIKSRERIRYSNWDGVEDARIKWLLSEMLHHDRKQRISSFDVINHPCFWKQERLISELDKLRDALFQDSVVQTSIAEVLSRDLESSKWLAEWQGKIPHHLLPWFRKQKAPQYPGKFASVWTAVSLIRNAHTHACQDRGFGANDLDGPASGMPNMIFFEHAAFAWFPALWDRLRRKFEASVGSYLKVTTQLSPQKLALLPYAALPRQPADSRTGSELEEIRKLREQVYALQLENAKLQARSPSPAPQPFKQQLPGPAPPVPGPAPPLITKNAQPKAIQVAKLSPGPTKPRGLTETLRVLNARKAASSEEQYECAFIAFLLEKAKQAPEYKRSEMGNLFKDYLESRRIPFQTRFGEMATTYETTHPSCYKLSGDLGDACIELFL